MCVNRQIIIEPNKTGGNESNHEYAISTDAAAAPDSANYTGATAASTASDWNGADYAVAVDDFIDEFKIDGNNYILNNENQKARPVEVLEDQEIANTEKKWAGKKWKIEETYNTMQ